MVMKKRRISDMSDLEVVGGARKAATSAGVERVAPVGSVTTAAPSPASAGQLDPLSIPSRKRRVAVRK